MALEVTTIIGCSNRCEYCPQDTLLRAYKGEKMMSFLAFTILLDNVPKSVRIDFTGFSEAFLNPFSSLMMRYALNAGYYVYLYTTLTGFNEDHAKVLEGAKFHDLVFHLYKGINMDEFNRKRELFEKYIHTANRMAVLDSENGSINTSTWSRGGNNWDVKPQTGKFKCALAGKLFNNNVVLPNGDVYLCCQDYGLKHKIGNLFRTKYNDLNRQKIIDLSNEDDSKIICRKCELFQCYTS